MNPAVRKCRPGIAVAFFVGSALVAASCSTPADGEDTNVGWQTVECRDGTGRSDCCPSEVESGHACTTANAECWTKCTQSWRGHYVCSDGEWLAGHGLFPCGADAGTAGGAEGGSSADCSGCPTSARAECARAADDCAAKGASRGDCQRAIDAFCALAALDGGLSSSDAASGCRIPEGADTSSDGGGAGCALSIPGPLCGPTAGQYELTCRESGIGAQPPEPAPTLGCTMVPMPTPLGTIFYCCPCGS